MDNIKTDEAATLCCVRCGLRGEEQLFLKTEAARGRGEWCFTFRLHSFCDYIQRQVCVHQALELS